MRRSGNLPELSVGAVSDGSRLSMTTTNRSTSTTATTTTSATTGTTISSSSARSSPSPASGGGGSGFFSAFRACFSPPATQEGGLDNVELPAPAPAVDEGTGHWMEEQQPAAAGGLNEDQRRIIAMRMSSPSTRPSIDERPPGSVSFTIQQLKKATRGFSKDAVIGSGGTGVVYRGELEDGTAIAVKRCNKDKSWDKEFENEIEMLKNIEHMNLVRLYGYVENPADGEKLIVVEFVPNGNLRQHLDCENERPPLDLSTRLDIAMDVARAITYLHTYSDHPVIHRDIKPANVLLTNRPLRAKVADFGFAKRAPTEEGVTHVTTLVKGTPGYIDPEYLNTNQLTTKSDVYSFGVLLVELMTGRRAVDSKSGKHRITQKWALERYLAGRAVETVDPNVGEVTPAVEAAINGVYGVAAKCMAATRAERPDMLSCNKELSGVRKAYRDAVAASTPSRYR